MAEEPVYTFDRQSMRRISAAVQKSEGVKDRKGNKWYPVKGGGGGATLQIGKTKADQAWAINNEATLDVWKRNADGDMEAVTKEDGTQMTFTAFNCFASIEADKFVGCLNGFLISAEC